MFVGFVFNFDALTCIVGSFRDSCMAFWKPGALSGNCFSGIETLSRMTLSPSVPATLGGKMWVLGCSNSYQTVAKYLKTGKQLPVPRRL